MNRGGSVFSLLRFSRRGAAGAHQSACARQDQRRGGGLGDGGRHRGPSGGGYPPAGVISFAAPVSARITDAANTVMVHAAVSDGYLIVSVRMVVIPVQSPKTLHLRSILKARKQSRLLAQNHELKSRVRLDVPVAVQA